MNSNFSSFIILAGMRTGSNLLEETLNQSEDIRCYGEAFNPHFVGYPKNSELLGVTLTGRDSDPIALLEKMKTASGQLPGFRFFQDHDQRVFKHCMHDERCAKIVLFRNPVDTYVSLEIARRTDQWRLGDVKNAKSAKIAFSKPEFEGHLHSRRAYYEDIGKQLQITGQTAFYLSYDDLTDSTILAGLMRYLGIQVQKLKPSSKTKKQNPSSLKDKVENYSEMESIVSSSDYFSLSGSPNFEPKRGPSVPNYIASSEAPLIFLPIKGNANERVIDWLASFAGNDVDQLISGFTQKTLRQWKRQSKGHRSFTVIIHPVQRVLNAYFKHIATPGPDQFVKIRQILVDRYGLPDLDVDASAEAHRKGVLSFSEFLKGNLVGQTGIRVDASWASQSESLSGISTFMHPDHIIRDSELKEGLEWLSKMVGYESSKLNDEPAERLTFMTQLYCDDIETSVRAAYQRDYMMFGFGPWTPVNN